MTITFNTKGHDDFIDFIKAYAILCVLIGHTFLLLDKIGYGIWAGTQVPLFILVQTFHYYKKEESSINIKKIAWRVLLPFFIFEVVIFIISIIRGIDCNILINKMLQRGGFGPGAYYPWIYFQVALLLPFFAGLLNKTNKYVSLTVFLILCEGLEIILSIFDMPDGLYRLLVLRYIFLLYLGWIWAKEGIKLNGLTICLSLFSLIATIYFEYFSINDEPWFYVTGWRFHRWPCYIWVAYGLTSVLYVLWKKICCHQLFIKVTRTLAAASYEIFLVQMSVIFLFHKEDLTFMHSKIVGYLLWLTIVWIVSLYGGILLNRLKHKSFEKHVNYTVRNTNEQK